MTNSYRIVTIKKTAAGRVEKLTGNRKKKLPIGIEDFKEIMTEGFYYADKTGLIQIGRAHV